MSLCRFTDFPWEVGDVTEDGYLVYRVDYAVPISVRVHNYTVRSRIDLRGVLHEEPEESRRRVWLVKPCHSGQLPLSPSD